MTVSPEHTELNEQLNAYLDGEVDETVRAAFERHLQTCPDCQLELEQLRATRAAVQVLSVLRAPRPMTITAPAAAGAAAAPGGRLARWLPWTWRLGAFAAAGCVLVGAVSATLPAQPNASLAAKVAPMEAARPAAGAPANQQSAPRAPTSSQQGATQAAAGAAADQRLASVPQASPPPATPQPALAPPAAAGATTNQQVPAAQATPPQTAQQGTAQQAQAPAAPDLSVQRDRGGTLSASEPPAAATQPAAARQAAPGAAAGNVGVHAPTDVTVSVADARTESGGPGVATRSAGAPDTRATAPYWLGAGVLLALGSGAAFAVDRKRSRPA